MNVLVAYDGSECAIEALRDLSRMGLPAESSIHVVTIPDVWMLELPDEADHEHAWSDPSNHGVALSDSRTLRSAVAARTTAASGADMIRDIGSHWNVTWGVVPLSPAEGILREIDERKPDLVVVGTHGRSLVTRAFLGSISLKVLHHARCSVRVARHVATPPGQPLRIVVAVDGSDGSKHALDVVASRHFPAGSVVRVIAVLSPATFPTSPSIGYDITQWVTEGRDLERKVLQHAVDEAVARLSAAGMRAEGELLEGGPASTILGSAAEWGADAIYLGAQAHPALERIILGSVSSAVASRARCSVEIIRSQN